MSASSPQPRRYAVAKRAVDPEIAQTIQGFLATVAPGELEEAAATGGDVTGRIQSSLGPIGFMGPIGVRMALGRERVEEIAGYDRSDLDALLDAVCDSLPRHGAILRRNREWAIGQLEFLKAMVVG